MLINIHKEENYSTPSVGTAEIVPDTAFYRKYNFHMGEMCQYLIVSSLNLTASIIPGTFPTLTIDNKILKISASKTEKLL
jgi:hypothetical protein